jgi:hypothetical protein
MRRFNILLAGLALALSGCSTDGTNRLFPQALQNIIPGRPTPAGPTAAQIRSQLSPDVRAQLGAPVKIATLEEVNLASVIVLRARNGNVETYFTPDGISVSLRDGIVVATRGLGFDLMTADVSDVYRAMRAGQSAVRIHRYLDGENHVIIRSFICDYAGRTEVIETCHTEGFTITNSYRLAGGRIIASRQWISPQRGYIRIESVE